MGSLAVMPTCADSMAYKPDSEIVAEPVNYVHAMKQKNFRTHVARCINYWLEIPEDKVAKPLQIGARLHSATLVIDDIQDGSDLRRGSPAAHVVYGTPFSINSANYAYFEVLKELLAYRNLAAVDVFAKYMLEGHEGQGMDIYWRDVATEMKDIPTEDVYESVVVKKTTAPFHMSIQLLLKLERPDETRDFDKLMNLLGVSYQVRDDYLNLSSKEYESTKGYCEDITEGKYSYPIIHALWNGSERQRERLFEILRLHTLDRGLKSEALKIIRDIGSLEYTKVKFLDLVAEIKKEIAILGGNPKLEEFLRKNYTLDI